MPQPQCSLFVGHVNGRALMRITGEIDQSNVDRLEQTLALIDGPFTWPTKSEHCGCGIGGHLLVLNPESQTRLLESLP